MTYASKRCHECGQIIKPKRPLEIVEYIKKEDSLLEAKLRSIEEKMTFLQDRK